MSTWDGDGFEYPAVSHKAILSCASPALLLAVVCLLPFLNKPFLIDDPYFLAMAHQILRHPLHPMDFEICWNIGPTCMKAYSLTPGNTLMGYALLPTAWFGSSEWMAHLTQLCFVVIAVIAMSSFVLRLGWSNSDAVTSTLLLVALPPFLPMASTSMPDTLAAAVTLVAFERLSAWKASAKWRHGVAAGIALGLAGIARAHLALVVPLSAFFLFDTVNPREMLIQFRQRMWLWSPVVIGACVLSAIIYLTRERSLVLDPPPIFSGSQNIPRNLAAYLLYLCFPLPLAGYRLLARWTTVPRRVMAVLAFSSAVGVLANSRVVFLAFLGFCVLVDYLLEVVHDRNQFGLFLALWLLLPLPIVYYGHLPIKYFLPCMPAIVLACLRLGKLLPPRRTRFVVTCLILGAVTYSIFILRSDAEFAQLGKDAMGKLIRPRVAAGERVWFGGQFSAYWYAPRMGAELITPNHGPKPGDLVAVGLFEGGDATLSKFPKRSLVQRETHTYQFGRTMGAGIGLYTNLQGFWLWGFGASENDRYELWRID